MFYLLDKSFLLSLSRGHLSSTIAPRLPATVFISAASDPGAGMRHKQVLTRAEPLTAKALGTNTQGLGICCVLGAGISSPCDRQG